MSSTNNLQTNKSGCHLQSGNYVYTTACVVYMSCIPSGPKRYDLIDGYWTYRHNNSILHDLLSREFTEHLDSEVDLTKLENYHRLADGDAWS